MSVGRVIDRKFTSGPNKIGIDSLSEIKRETVNISPYGNNNSTIYRHDSNNRIMFRIMAYSNSFLNTAETFLSFNIQTTGQSATAFNILGNGAHVFEKMVIKSNNGLVISEETNLNLLSRMFSIHRKMGTGLDEGCYGGNHDIDPTSAKATALGTKLRSAGGLDVIMRFHSSLLDVDLQSYIPLGMLDGGGGFSFDIEMTLCTPKVVLKTGLSTVTSPSYRIRNPIMNLSLLKMTPELARKYESGTDSRIVIPFKVYRCHLNGLTSNLKQTLTVHESSTNLKRVFNVLAKSQQAVDAVEKNAFYGSVNDTDIKVESYNFQIGNQYIFSEAVDETNKSNNMITMTHVKNGSHDQDVCKVFEQPADSSTTLDSCFESDKAKMFHTVCNFEYSNHDVKQPNSRPELGISSSTPLLIHYKFSSDPTEYTLHSFAEIGYNLIISDGQIKYEEVRPGENIVY